MTDHLKQRRDQIDLIDEELLKLINTRASIALQIGNLKIIRHTVLSVRLKY